MFNFHCITKEEKEHNPKWPETPDHPYRILIIWGSDSGKINVLLNLINHEPDIDKIYLYAKDGYNAKYKLLINKRESTGLKYLNDLKALLNTQLTWMVFIKILKIQSKQKSKNINYIWWYDCWYT